jgi:divalent metal cation (Fe/Co/Zn/Cd) transporter
MRGKEPTSRRPFPGTALHLRALRLEGLTIAWMVVEATVSIGAGVRAGSLLLLAFGADSLIELLSAGVLYGRLRAETRAVAVDDAAREAMEKRAARIAGWLLVALALYVLLQAGYGLLHRHVAETSWPGIVVAVVAALGMPPLARAKIRVADAIGSRALRADAMETITCGYLAWVLLLGLAANALLHWWWLDSAAALVLVPFLIKEAREAITGDCCHACSGPEGP